MAVSFNISTVPLYTTTITTNNTTWNGNSFGNSTTLQADSTQFIHINGSPVVQWQFDPTAYLEPRDHGFNPSPSGFPMGACQDCSKNNVHQFSADKHLFVIQEEPDWQQLLAS